MATALLVHSETLGYNCRPKGSVCQSFAISTWFDIISPEIAHNRSDNLSYKGDFPVAIEVSAEALPCLIGEEFEPSPWFEITQERVALFADATNDHQYIHVDPERAANTPFGGTIAHGFLSLSLLVYLNSSTAKVPKNLQTIVNYGSDKVRYLAPVRVGKRIRSRQTVLEVTEKEPGTWLVKTAVTVEIEGENKPALVAELLMMMIAS